MNNHDKIIEIWGNTPLAKEIIQVLDDNEIDIYKLIDCCERKRQSILTAMGAVLQMNDQDLKNSYNFAK